MSAVPESIAGQVLVDVDSTVNAGCSNIETLARAAHDRMVEPDGLSEADALRIIDLIERMARALGNEVNTIAAKHGCSCVDHCDPG